MFQAWLHTVAFRPGIRCHEFPYETHTQEFDRAITSHTYSTVDDILVIKFKAVFL